MLDDFDKFIFGIVFLGIYTMVFETSFRVEKNKISEKTNVSIIVRFYRVNKMLDKINNLRMR
jgi:hypothetical protein